MRADIERWNRKYAGKEVVTEPAGEPELVSLSKQTAGEGLALELACGRGANALYLATLGYKVIAMDGAINGLRSCQLGAEKLGLPVYSVVVDLDRLTLPPERFQFISVVRYLNRDLFATIARALAPGGILFYKTFNQEHLTSRPAFNPDFVLAENELSDAFANLEPISQGDRGGSSYLLARRGYR